MKYWIIVLLLIAAEAWAGITGKIIGHVNDADSGQPLVGVNVVVTDQRLGAATDLDGFYQILNLSPGFYTLHFSSIGYVPVQMEQVQVNTDLTVNIDVELQPTVLEAAEAIVVTAEREQIQVDQTFAASYVDAERIQSMPVKEISQVIDIQAGVVDGHFRGGRTGEVSYMVDGIPMNDVYDGSRGATVDVAAVQELQVISGTFNAEYGQAMSGVVNTITKDGGQQFHGHTSLYMGDYISHVFRDNAADFLHIDHIDPLTIANGEFSLSGPIMDDDLTFFFNGRYFRNLGWLEGKQEFATDEYHYITGAVEEWMIMDDGTLLPHEERAGNRIFYFEEINDTLIGLRDAPSGGGDWRYMNSEQKYSGQFKLTWTINPLLKLRFNTILNQREYQDYNHDYVYNPDGRVNRFSKNNTFALKLDHTLSGTTFYTLSLAHTWNEYEHYRYKDLLDSRMVNPGIFDFHGTLFYNVGGTENQHFNRRSRTWVVRFDMNSQVTPVHGLKGGLEFKRHHLYYNDVTPVTEVTFNPIDFRTYHPDFYIPGPTTLNNTSYDRFPYDAALYLQDKAEYGDFIVNAGLRLDFFDPNVDVPADPADPNIHNPLRPEHIEDTLEERETYWWNSVDPKLQVSPRVAIAYPISDRGVISISYGHFFQRPSFEVLYTNPDYKWDVNDKYPLIGNPDLQAEKTVTFEVGLQQALNDMLTMNATLYNRDIRNLVSTDKVVPLASTGQYVQYVNRDFGYVRGGTLTLDRRFDSHFSFSLAYTLQFAQGNASDREEARRAIEGNKEPDKTMVPLNWDRRHTLNGNFNFNWDGLWGFSLLGTFGSGLPYTPEIQSDDVRVGLNENSGRKPVYLNLDLNAYYRLWRKGSNSAQLFLQVLNLFDRANENGVYASTGRAGYDLYPHTNDDFMVDPTHWSRPREVTLGVQMEF